MRHPRVAGSCVVAAFRNMIKPLANLSINDTTPFIECKTHSNMKCGDKLMYSARKSATNTGLPKSWSASFSNDSLNDCRNVGMYDRCSTNLTTSFNYPNRLMWIVANANLLKNLHFWASQCKPIQHWNFTICAVNWLIIKFNQCSCWSKRHFVWSSTGSTSPQ